MSLDLTDVKTFNDVTSYLKRNQFSKEFIDFILENKDKFAKKMVEEKSVDTVEAGVQRMLNIQDSLDGGYTALMYASQNSKIENLEETLEMLIDAKTDLNIQDIDGYTALMLASLFSNTSSSNDTVKMLIDAKADLNIQDIDGKTALMFATLLSNRSSSNDTVKMLIDAKADINLVDKGGNTALMLAVQNLGESTEEAVKMLIDAGTDLLIINEENETAYDILKDLEPDDSPLLQKFYERLDLTDVKTFNDVTSYLKRNQFSKEFIDFILENKDKFAKKMVEEKSVDTVEAGVQRILNIQDIDGYTALMYASQNSKIKKMEDTVKMLIDAGADQFIRNIDGYTAYDILKEVATDSPLLQKFYVENELKELLKQRIVVNISKDVSFNDPITLEDEDINIAEYIKKDSDNIVIVYDNIQNIYQQKDSDNKKKDPEVIVYDKYRYHFTNRRIIEEQKEDATFYPCLKTMTMIDLDETNIDEIKPLYDLKKIGLFANLCVMHEVFDNPKSQLFALINTEERYPSFISDGILNIRRDGISGHHCQSGIESNISYMLVAIPSCEDNPGAVRMGGNKKTNKVKRQGQGQNTKKKRQGQGQNTKKKRQGKGQGQNTKKKRQGKGQGQNTKKKRQ